MSYVPARACVFIARYLSAARKECTRPSVVLRILVLFAVVTQHEVYICYLQDTATTEVVMNLKW